MRGFVRKITASMQRKLTLKLMAKASFGCLLLTLIWVLYDMLMPARIHYLREIELISCWIILLVGWIVYFLNQFRDKRKQ